MAGRSAPFNIDQGAGACMSGLVWFGEVVLVLFDLSLIYTYRACLLVIARWVYIWEAESFF